MGITEKTMETTIMGYIGFTLGSFSCHRHTIWCFALRISMVQQVHGTYAPSTQERSSCYDQRGPFGSCECMWVELKITVPVWVPEVLGAAYYGGSKKEP